MGRTTVQAVVSTSLAIGEAAERVQRSTVIRPGQRGQRRKERITVLRCPHVASYLRAGTIGGHAAVMRRVLPPSCLQGTHGQTPCSRRLRLAACE